MEDEKKSSAFDIFKDLLFNTDDFFEDNIKFFETLIQVEENTKNNTIKNEEKFAKLYEDVNSEKMKLAIKKSLDEVYVQLLELDKEIEKNKKTLKDFTDMKEKLT